MFQDVFAVDLIVQKVEAELRLRLRFDVELSLKAPQYFLPVFRSSMRKSLDPCRLQKPWQKSGAFPPPELPGFDGTMRLSELPHGPPSSGVWVANLCRAGLPRYPDDLAYVPSPLPRRTRQERPASLLDRRHAEGVPPALRGLCHGASAQPVARQSRPSATGANQQVSGWNLPPLVVRALRPRGALNRRMVVVFISGLILRQNVRFLISKCEKAQRDKIR